MPNKNDIFKLDYLLIGAVVLAVFIGILAIYSTGFDPIEKVNNGLYKKQLLFFLIGIVMMIGISFISYQQLGEFSLLIFGGILLITILTTVFGSTIRGTRAWIHLGFVSIQPSEFMKLAVVILLAKYLELREREMHHFRELIIPSVMVFIPVLVILAQPDFGTAMVFIPILFVMLFIGGADASQLFSIVSIVVISLCVPLIITYREWLGAGDDSPVISFFKTGSLPFLIAGIILLIGIAAYIIHVIMMKKVFRKIYIPAFVLSLSLISSTIIQRFIKDYQKKRILVFFSPDLDPHGSGYNVIQSKIAIGSGGFFGKGYIKGSQSQLGFLPEKSTDFIFSVITEEFGFVGAMIVLILLGIVVFKGIQIALQTRDKFAALLATGISTIFLCHIIINLGMVMGVTPATGLPLSFISYG
ncbi:MAG: rod shape-determining protein RodA, partial [Spirochaetota bacterium]